MVGASPSGPALTYHAVHRMFERVNERAGTTATLHSLRHTAAYRMAEDPALPLTDVQLVLGHAQLTTTQIYLTPRKEDVIRRVLAHHAEQTRQAAERARPALRPATGPRPWASCSGTRHRDHRSGGRARHRAAGTDGTAGIGTCTFPGPACGMGWPATWRGREEVWEQLTSPPFVLENTGTESKRVRGLARLLDWLEDQPGQTWQERWLASGADAAGTSWRQVPMAGWTTTASGLSGCGPGCPSALKVAICADLIRPSLGWLVSAAAKGALVRDLGRSRDPEGFARLTAQCDEDPGISARARLRTLQRAPDHRCQGRRPADIIVGDVLELLDAETSVLAGIGQVTPAVLPDTARDWGSSATGRQPGCGSCAPPAS